MDWRLVTILLSCAFFVHSVNGQSCGIIGDTTNPFPIPEDAPQGLPFPTYTLADDVVSVSAVAEIPELRFDVDLVNHKLLILPTADLQKFFDTSGRSYEISLQLTLSCGSSTSTPYVRFSVQDTNNRNPEFEPKSFSGEFTLPVYGTPLNWEEPIIVRDLDFLDQYTSMAITLEGDDILEFYPGYPMRFDHENSNPVRLDYYKVLFRLKPEVNVRPGLYNTILKATGVQNQQVTEFPITLNLLEKTVDTESPVIELNPAAISEEFKNEAGHSIPFAQVTDDFDSVNELVIVISADNVDLNAYFETDVIPTKIGGGSGNIVLKLKDVIPIDKLQSTNNLVRLTITVTDKAGRETKTYITLEFEPVVLKFTESYYKFELNEDSQRLLPEVQLEDGANTNTEIVFSIESSDGSDEYLAINPDGTDLRSTRTEEEIIDHDNEVNIFIITAKLGSEEIKIPVVVHNLPSASSSSSSTSTSTTEPETTTETATETTVTFPTETSTPCDCSSCFSSSTPSDTSPITNCPSIGTTDSSITDSCLPCDECTTTFSTSPLPCITENPICTCPTTDTSPITDSSTVPVTSSTDPSITSSTDSSITSSTDSSVTCAPVTAELCTTIMASSPSTTESSCVCPITTTNPGETDTTDPSITDRTSSSTPFPDITPCPTDATTTECPLTCPTTPDSEPCTTTPQDCPVTTCPGPEVSTCAPCPIDCSTTTKPDPNPVPTTEETICVVCPDCSNTGLVAGVAVAATAAVVSSGIAAYLVYKMLRQSRSILDDIEPVDYTPPSTKVDPEAGFKPTSTQYVSTENLGSSSIPYSDSITGGGGNFVKIDADGGAINTNVSQPSTSFPNNSSALTPKTIYNSTPAEIKAMYAKEPELQPIYDELNQTKAPSTESNYTYARPISEPDSISRLPSGTPLSEPDPDYKLVTFGDVKVDVIEDVGEEEEDEEDEEGEEEDSNHNTNI